MRPDDSDADRAEARSRSRWRAFAGVLREASYEVLPLPGTDDAVLAHVSREVPLTITTTEAKGLGPTLELAERLSRAGRTAAPHLVARLVRDGAHLDDIAARLREAGVEGVFVVGGDAREAVGPYPDALALLEALAERGHRFRHVGVGGYPEGHGTLGAQVMEEALARKAPHATHVITQLCFDPGATRTWAAETARRGIHLPVRVGLPGAVSRQKLVRISAGLGLGQSARFLLKQQGMFWRFFLPRGYHPGRLLRGLAPVLGQPGSTLQGAHFFTFNELQRTEAWRRSLIERLERR
ncbi:methylenetetrahydrofolate reductase (NADPH) [Kineococcus xinjiangensis]|uniref:Methylenetetrahydrofolate reductase n=1 Tax=Kineococcus xinjiangensis TaxID=512762 RepID=A0A2S6IDS9_9ACTN|nr:methylenetetrahydrofolate reductase [Kineococcus xinjiangensis]PPK92320.1 methylenetetrahydrofolate reductase (NADPH) [Kineococcus xinjiangensis]